MAQFVNAHVRKKKKEVGRSVQFPLRMSCGHTPSSYKRSTVKKRSNLQKTLEKRSNISTVEYFCTNTVHYINTGEHDGSKSGGII